MTEADFVARWTSEQDFYSAWGSFVTSEILKVLQDDKSFLELKKFLKIWPEPRVKDVDSLLGKAFHRNKRYEDPYRDIEDKVGVRFVVLLTSDIRRIADAIEKSDHWSASLDKDYEEDRERRPLEFTYQSVHYVVKAKNEVKTEKLVIPAGTPCEIQIRTLLQHAHSELTHDSIYKPEPGIEVNKKVERTVAKSMALIEAVDDFFISAVEQLSEATQLERSAIIDLNQLYETHVGLPPSTDKSSALVIRAFRARIGAGLHVNIVQFLEQKPVILDIIKARSGTSYLYRQGWILLVFWLVHIAPAQTAEQWPLTPEEIRPIYRDLGVPFPDGG